MTPFPLIKLLGKHGGTLNFLPKFLWSFSDRRKLKLMSSVQILEKTTLDMRTSTLAYLLSLSPPTHQSVSSHSFLMTVLSQNR